MLSMIADQWPCCCHAGKLQLAEDCNGVCISWLLIDRRMNADKTASRESCGAPSATAGDMMRLDEMQQRCHSNMFASKHKALMSICQHFRASCFVQGWGRCSFE
jgi:hypothetical protein